MSPSAVNDTNQPNQVTYESNLLVQIAPNDPTYTNDETLEKQRKLNSPKSSLVNYVKITPYNNNHETRNSPTSIEHNTSPKSETNTSPIGTVINGYRKVLPPNQGGSYKVKI